MIRSDEALWFLRGAADVARGFNGRTRKKGQLHRQVTCPAAYSRTHVLFNLARPNELVGPEAFYSITTQMRQCAELMAALLPGHGQATLSTLQN